MRLIVFNYRSMVRNLKFKLWKRRLRIYVTDLENDFSNFSMSWKRSWHCHVLIGTSIVYIRLPFHIKTSYSIIYHHFLEQVYDAVVGDVSIRESRSLYADFTLPYSESSVSMVVLFRDNKNKKAWLFLKPLTLDLWLTSAFFFAFIGLVVWILEHRINEDFRGPPSHQIGTSFWFSFSTMVYAQSNLPSPCSFFLWHFEYLFLDSSLN